MPEGRLRRGEAMLLVSALVAAGFLVSFGVLHYGFYTRKLLRDTPLYERYGDAIVHGHAVPYRDFAVEYPPGALPAFALPSLAAPAGDFGRYERLFEGLMLLCGAAAAALVGLVLARGAAGPLRLAAGTLLAGFAPLALGPVVLSRFDLWPALLAAAAVVAVAAGRSRLGAGLLGAGVAAKLYPAVLLPLVVAHAWRREGPRAALSSAAVAAGVAAAAFAPFLAVSPGGVWASLSGQASRPLQIESAAASALLAAHQAFGLGLTEVSSHGSDNLGGALPDALAAAQSLLGAAVLAAIWIGFARGPATTDRFLRFAAGAVCAFVVLNRVLSPQYLIWLFALVPLVRGRRGLAAGGLFLGAMVLTQLWFPYRYIGLVYGLDPRASWLVFARDLLLLALLVVLVWPATVARRAAAGAVAGLAAAALAAVGAAATSPAVRAATHAGLLVESGAAGRCGGANEAPELSGGRVAYEASVLPPLPRPGGCVTVTVTAPPRAQVFAVAYRGRFDPADPRSGYLGDAGRCTNVAGVAGRRLAYAFDAPAAPVALEVEECGSAGLVPPYVLDVRGAAGAPAAYAAAGARRRGAAITVRWRVAREAAGTAYVLFRERRGRLEPAATGRVRRAARGSYASTDAGAPLVRPLRYWILARAPGGRWSWHGPVGEG